MPLLRISENPDRRFLATFAVGLIVVSAILGTMRVARGDVAGAAAFWILGGGAGITSLIVPLVAAILYRGWMTVLAPIAWLASMVLLAIVYYCVVTPIALGLRLSGRDALSLRSNRGAKSVWTERTRKPDAADYFKQF